MYKEKKYSVGDMIHKIKYLHKLFNVKNYFFRIF